MKEIKNYLDDFFGILLWVILLYTLLKNELNYSYLIMLFIINENIERLRKTIEKNSKK